MEKYLKYKLCYVDTDSEYPGTDLRLYFTELEDITKQWGDDWGDVPYEHNAEPPYEYDYSAEEQGVENGVGIYPPIDIYKMVVRGGYNILTPRSHKLNSQFSVKDINSGITPWLSIAVKGSKENIHIKAGSTVEEVIEALKKADDYLTIYGELKGWKD